MVRTKLIVALVSALGLSLTAIGAKAAPAGPAVSIKDFMYNPADVVAKVGE